MHWSKIDKRIKELHGCIAGEYNEGSSNSSRIASSKRAEELMEELTIELNKKEK